MEFIELTQWIRILVRYCKHLSSLVTVEISDVSFRDVLFKTHQIRHTAVHRRVVNVSEIEKMIESAASLTTVLKDALRTRKIRLIQKEVRVRLEELKRAQNELETSMSEELTEVAHRRASSDKVEKKEIERMFNEGSQNRLRLESALNEFLIQRQTCTDLDSHHLEEMSGAEANDASLKLEGFGIR